jgi:hypothetical protein
MRTTMTSRRRMVAGGFLAAIAAIGGGIWAAQRDDGPSAVLGSKVTRCQTADGTVVSAGRRLTAENAPLTVTVSGGRVTAVLAPAFKAEPGSPQDHPAASFTIGRPEISAGKLIADVAIRNLTDCATQVSDAQAVAQRDGAGAVASPILFGASDRVVVTAGHVTAGSFSMPIDGDGTYEISASTETEFGRVR